MKILLIAFLFLFQELPNAQNVEVLQVEFLRAQEASIIKDGDSVIILAKELQPGREHGIQLKSELDISHVNAFLISTGNLEDAFPPKVIRPADNGELIIKGKPGDKYAMEVFLASGVSNWITASIEGDSGGPDPPPTDPSDWEALIEAVKTKTPDEPEVKAILISSYKSSLNTVTNNPAFPTADACRTYLSNARAKAFTDQIAILNKDWSVLLYAISDQVKDISDKDTYIEAMTVVVQTLENLP